MRHLAAAEENYVHTRICATAAALQQMRSLC